MTAFRTIADVLARFPGYPPERFPLSPFPGTATVQDLADDLARRERTCELIDGVLVEKPRRSFRDQLVVGHLGNAIGHFADAHDLGPVVGPRAAVVLSPGRVRAPDAAFYGWDKLPGRRLPDEEIPELVPDLAADVLSSNAAPTEYAGRLADYFFSGVRLVWYVDARTRTVDVFTAVDASVTLTAADTLTGGAVLPGFAVPVADLFG